jgi:hypothetical protein
LSDKTIAEIDTVIFFILCLVGYCPKHWSEAIDVMIPKKAASKHGEKLRINVLFHTLFNMLNKKVSKAAIYQATRIQETPRQKEDFEQSTVA